MTADIVSESPLLAGHEQLWEGLYLSRQHEPSVSFEWSDALTRSHLEPGDHFFLLRVSRGEDVRCLVPLVMRPTSVYGATVTVLRPLSERYNTHSDLLAVDLDDDTTDAFVRALFSLGPRWDVFTMSNLLDGHPLLRRADRSLEARGAEVSVRDGEASYYLELPGSFEEYLAGRSAKFRNHLKRAAKRLEGECRTTVVEGESAGTFDRAYEMLLEVERASWKHAHGTAISAIDRQTRFYREMCRGAFTRDRLHLQFLMCDGHPIAYNMGYLQNDAYSYLKTSYDDRYKALGPATYLRAALIASLIERGTRIVDFPAEPYDWERQWTGTARWHKSLHIYSGSAKARALALVDRLRRPSASERRIQHHDPLSVRPPG